MVGRKPGYKRTEYTGQGEVYSCCVCGSSVDWNLMQKDKRREKGLVVPNICILCYNSRNTARKTEYKRRYRRKNPERVRDTYRAWQLQKIYGISIEEWSALFKSQNKRCSICKSKQSGWSKGWHTDHDHSTGKIRGILCHQCNLMIGLAKDDQSILLAAIR